MFAARKPKASTTEPPRWYEMAGKMSNRIIVEVSGINRVVYDI